MDDLLSIGEFSDRSGLSQKRLRAYAAAGLLVPAAVDSSSGYRYYGVGQLRDAHLIDALRRADLPLSAIAELLPARGSVDLEPWARRLEEQSTARRGALEQARRLLADGGRPDARKSGGPMSTLTMAARTATGAGRASNQDAIITGDRIAGVADGMGGGPGGDVAATLAAVILRAGFVDGGPGELAAVTRSANAAIFERASAEPRLRGMGTTVCCVGLLDGGGLSLVSVGDSRAYVLRDGELRRLTEDHTIVAELVRRGELDPSLADRHPHRHVLTRVLGVGPVVEAESATIDVGDADLLLLCTDGLSGRLSDVEIGSLLTAGGTLSEVADRLVDRAVAVGADDDVTVVVVRVCRSGA